MPRRKRTYYDTAVWRRELEQVGIEFGRGVNLRVPIYNVTQLRNAAKVLFELSTKLTTISQINWPERKQVFEQVRALREARAKLRLPPSYGA